jgi:hypothetical protein
MQIILGILLLGMSNVSLATKIKSSLYSYLSSAQLSMISGFLIAVQHRAKQIRVNSLVLIVFVVHLLLYGVFGCVVSTFGQTEVGITTFSAHGAMSSFTMLNPLNKFILSGDWILHVANGRVTEFNVNMTAILSNGTHFHTHEITNFHQATNESPVHLGLNNTVLIKGSSDVGANHVTTWRNVPTVITISNGKLLVIMLDDKATQHHFAAQPIYGFVKELATSISNG